MFTVKKKPLTPNIIWDGSAGRPLCNFGHKGTITTNDRDLAEKLAALGHEVTGEADAPAQQEPPADTDEPSQDGAGADTADNAENGTGQKLEGTETADTPAQQAASPAVNGRRNRK